MVRGRHAPFAFGRDEVVRNALDDLPDSLNPALVTEALEHAKDDFVPSGRPWCLLGALFGQELGDRSAQFGARCVHNLLAKQLAVVVHLVPEAAFCRSHSAVSQSVKALTEADEPRVFGPTKLTKIAFAG